MCDNMKEAKQNQINLQVFMQSWMMLPSHSLQLTTTLGGDGKKVDTIGFLYTRLSFKPYSYILTINIL